MLSKHKCSEGAEDQYNELRMLIILYAKFAARVMRLATLGVVRGAWPVPVPLTVPSSDLASSGLDFMEARIVPARTSESAAGRPPAPAGCQEGGM